MSTLDPMEERAAATILVEATDHAAAAADPQVSAFLQGCSDLLGREAASIMDLRWRQGLDADEVSTRLSIPVEWVNDQVAMLPSLYGNMVRSRILWFGGQPQHDELSGQLAAAAATSFDATTSRTILAHARTCEICDANTTMRIEPIAAFSESSPPAAPLSVAGPPAGASPTQPTPTSAAGTRIAAATAAGSAAAATSAIAASGAGSPGATGSPAGPPPPAGARHAPVGGTAPDEDASRKKKFLIGGIVGGVVLVLLIGFLLTRGGSSKEDDQVATGGASPTTVDNKQYASTSTTAPTTTTTRPPTTTTTEAPPEPDKIEANINGAPSANVPQGFPTSSATVSWVSIIAPVPAAPAGGGDGAGDASSAPAERWVEISGPGISTARQPESGSLSVCPSAEPDICNVVPGSYGYTVTLFVNGENKASQTVTLIVDPPVEPPPAP